MTSEVISVETGARLHVGFRNLSQERDPLFGGIGIAIDEPRVEVIARAARDLSCTHRRAHTIAGRVISHLGVDGADITVRRTLPTHQGYGSGTQLALAVAVAIAHAHGIEPEVRSLAHLLDRGTRSGVGVACFESGGFIVDAGRPTDAMLARGSRHHIPPVDRHVPLPQDWRFLLVHPAIRPGRSGDREAQSIERTIETADPQIADRIEELLETNVLPGIQREDIERFGDGITGIDRLTGEWFAAEQGDAYRPPCDAIVASLAETDSIAGWGQSSWGPLCYGVTTQTSADEAIAAGEVALDRAGLPGTVELVRPRNRGADVQLADPTTPTQPGRNHQ